MMADEAAPPEPESETAEKSDAPVPAEAPMFCAAVEYYSHGYYIVKGTFTEFLPDTSLVQPLYSLDGENWQPCGRTWDLSWLGAEEETALAKLQNQICLDNSNEPLKSYLNEELDRFYLKLHITRENGESYETQAAMIERGDPQPISKEINLIANFAPSIRVREMRPFNVYGRYQITVNANAAPEDISAFLPDTLPVTIGLYQGIDFITEGVIDCPVTWKPLSYSQLTAGESITIPDAAEEIIVPAGTLLNTPMGIFQLDEPLGLNQEGITDEIRLVLNVVSEKEAPAGVLTAENAGLELSFSLKPTGATAIRAYTFSANDNEWKELPALPFLDAVNAQPSTANSGYALVISKDQEPYRSYLSAETAGENPSPFLIGLQIEGGVYDGRQLILPWPGSYDLPSNLPVLGGSGGNEGNAGAGNKGDSTEEGQRPELPRQPEEEKTEETLTAPTQKPEDNAEEPPASPIQKQDNVETQQTDRSQASEPMLTEQPPNPPSDHGTQTDLPAETNTPGHEKPGQENQQNQNERPAPDEQNASEQPAPAAAAQAATDLSDDEKYSEALPAADTETDGHEPFLPIAAASAAGLFIAVFIHKTAVRRSAGTP